MPLFRRLFRLGAVSVPVAAGGWYYYTRDTVFVPFTRHDADYDTAALRRVNPHSNPPACIDHAVRRVPFDQLRSTDAEELARDFCRGIWCGPGYWYQRRYLEKKYRALTGREDHLWDRHELGASNYPMGTRITDHFEVVERAPGKITVRCGDSPLNVGLRPEDGIFSMEVTTDKDAATFHLKSVMMNSTPEGKSTAPLPWVFQWLHREYTKLWMETSVRSLIK